MIKQGREYRTMAVMAPSEEKRLDSDCYVEGYATTFNDPYVLWTTEDGIEIKEQVDRHALDDADLTDVVFQYNHFGKVFARTKMKKGASPTLILEPQDHGLFVAADLSKTESARGMFEEIETGLVHQMSFGFTVAEDSYDRETHTRTILRIAKVYDVSAVDFPANDGTDISSRDWFNGVIEAEQQERLEREKQINLIKIRKRIMEVRK